MKLFDDTFNYVSFIFDKFSVKGMSLFAVIVSDGGEEVIRRIDKSARKRPSEDWKQSDDEKKRKLQKNTVKCMDDTASESENYISSPDAAAQAEDATTQDGIVETKGRSRCDALKINDSEDSAYNQRM